MRLFNLCLDHPLRWCDVRCCRSPPIRACWRWAVWLAWWGGRSGQSPLRPRQSPARRPAGCTRCYRGTFSLPRRCSLWARWWCGAGRFAPRWGAHTVVLCCDLLGDAVNGIARACATTVLVGLVWFGFLLAELPQTNTPQESTVVVLVCCRNS